jgi:potassium channel subfamily K
MLKGLGARRSHTATATAVHAADLFTRGAAFHKSQQSYQQGATAPAEEDKTWPLVKYGCLATTVYLLLGTTVYCLKDGRSFLDGFYLTIFTTTTVGFGDLSPTSTVTKMFTCGFVFVGLMGIGQVLEFLVDYIVHGRLTRRLQHTKDLFHPDPEVPEVNDGGMEEEPLLPRWEKLPARVQYCIPKETLPIFQALGHCLFVILLIVLVGCLGFSLLVDSHIYTDALYMAIMIVTTVGYGDVVPSCPYSKMFACFYSIFGTIMVAQAISTFTSAVSDYRLRAKYFQTLSKSVLDWDTFMQADANHSQQLSRSDFLLFRLDQMQLIPEDVRHQILDQFDRMDQNKDGVLTMVSLKS